MEVIELEAQPAAVVSCRLHLSELDRSLERVLPPLLQQLHAAGATVAGPPFTRFVGFAEDGRLDLESGYPVLEPAQLSAPAQSIVLPAGPAATMPYFGPYEGLPSVHAELDEWLESTGRRPSGPRWEVYVTGDSEESGPARRLTRLFQPLAPK